MVRRSAIVRSPSRRRGCAFRSGDLKCIGGARSATLGILRSTMGDRAFRGEGGGGEGSGGEGRGGERGMAGRRVARATTRYDGERGMRDGLAEAGFGVVPRDVVFNRSAGRGWVTRLNGRHNGAMFGFQTCGGG